MHAHLVYYRRHRLHDIVLIAKKARKLCALITTPVIALSVCAAQSGQQNVQLSL